MIAGWSARPLPRTHCVFIWLLVLFSCLFFYSHMKMGNRAKENWVEAVRSGLWVRLCKQHCSQNRQETCTRRRLTWWSVWVKKRANRYEREPPAPRVCGVWRIDSDPAFWHKRICMLNIPADYDMRESLQDKSLLCESRDLIWYRLWSNIILLLKTSVDIYFNVNATLFPYNKHGKQKNKNKKSNSEILMAKCFQHFIEQSALSVFYINIITNDNTGAARWLSG